MRGWHNESIRHSLASKGVQTSKNKVQERIDFSDTEIFEDYLMHHCHIYALFLNEHFGYDIYGVTPKGSYDSNTFPFHFVVKVDGEYYDANGPDPIERKKELWKRIYADDEVVIKSIDPDELEKELIDRNFGEKKEEIYDKLEKEFKEE